MSETQKVKISKDNATLLLAAADELKVDRSEVKVSEGTFVVPAEIAEKAGLGGKPKKAQNRTARAAKKAAESKADDKSAPESKKEDN